MIEIDTCHRKLIGAMVAAAKPERILELGFGTGLTTDELMYNTYSIVTVVDNWFDFHNREPHDLINNYVLNGATFIQANESDYLFSQPSDTFDFLVSDADHTGDWCEEHFRVTKPGSWCFFHDTNQPHIYPGLARTVEYVKERGWMYEHFTKSTLPVEECHRGLLMVRNGK